MYCEIDPNIRIRGNQTYCSFDDCWGSPAKLHHAMISPGYRITAFESESKVFFPAIITSIDTEKELVYLAVAWREGYNGVTVYDE